MSVDPEAAIEKLAEYRATSKKKTNTVESDPSDGKDSIFRKFFLKYYWFNATVVTTLIFTLLIGGWNVLSPIWVITGILVLTVLLRQTFRTLTRLEVSLGRNTTLDDVIVVLLIAAGFTLYSLFEVIPQSSFIQIHLGLTFVWLLQILFVNYLKPKISHAKGHGIVETVKVTSRVEKMKQFLTLKRSIVFIVSIALSLGILVIRNM